ncbi:RIPP1 protein, partial [Malurus elegans]|nr:RIPP1 protein [Malurus elegans]
PRALPLWRPWLPRAQEGPGTRREEMDPARARAAEGDGGPSKALAFFQHPVRYVPCSGAPGGRERQAGGGSPWLSPRRLLWPKSKAFDHLYSVGEKLLENFPVQATLFFYEDSGSEEEEEEEEEDDEEEEAAGDVTAGHPRHAGSPGPS